MNKKGKLVIFCMIFVVSYAFSQKNSFLYNQAPVFNGFKKPMPASILLNNALFTNLPNKPYILPTFYYTQLGFFCKQEIKFEKITKIPFKFRLGSIEECNRLEGKYCGGR